MKYIITSLLFVTITLTMCAQDKEHIDLLNTEEGWRKEAFRFPMRFAQEVDFDGVADVRFTKGWQDQTSPEFWSYIFAWNIILEEKLSESAIENYMHLYFDGLMNVVKKDKSMVLPPSSAVFTSTETLKGVDYKGKIRFYDAFFTEDIMTLNVLVTYKYCQEENKTIYVFRLSPKDMDDAIWQHIKKPSLKKDICKL